MPTDRLPPVDAKSPPPDVSIGRSLLVLSAIAVIAQFAGLQLRQAVFGGTAWLSSVKYVDWGERAGLTAILIVVGVAGTGTWLLAWIGGLRLLNVSKARALSIAAATWIVALAADFLVRQKVHGLLGDAYRFVDVSYNSGGTRAVLRNFCDWYGDLILKGALVCIALGAAAYVLSRFLRNPRRSWGWVDRTPLRTQIWIVLAADMMLILFLTAGSRLWPDTRELVATETIVGHPLARLVSISTDFDGDGWSPFDNPPDTHPFDAALCPHAVDNPDDGIDQDLLAGDWSLKGLDPDRRAALDALSDVPPVRFTERKNVVLILLESARWDSLETDVRGQAVMPQVRKLIADGALAPTHAYASNGFTHPAIMQLSWGGFFPPGTTLLDDFRSNGYDIAAFSGYNLQEEGFDRILGLRAGDHIVDARHLPVTAPFRTVPARRLVEPLSTFLRERPRERPFLLFVYFDDAHFPYLQDNPPILSDGPISIGRIRSDNREELGRAYYNQVYHVDQAIGRVMQGLTDAVCADDTIVVLMSDHGESLFDDGLLLGHGVRLNDVMTHSIFVVANAPQDVPDWVSHYHLRGLLRQFLTQPPVREPRVVPVPGRRLLQFLGSPTNPFQIAEVSLEEGRLIYDFRRNRVWDERSGTQVAFTEDGPDPDLCRRARAMILGWEYLQYCNRDRR